MLACVLTLAVAGLALQGCLLFTGPVNAPPRVEIVNPNGPPARGGKAKLVAMASDPDGGAITLAWSTLPKSCVEPLDPAMRPPATFISPPGDPEFEVKFGAGDPPTVCVFVLATDAHGATAVAQLEVSSFDHPPVPVITVVKPTSMNGNGLYPLYSVFHLSAAKSSDPDGDPLEPTFTVGGFPQAAMPTPRTTDCPDATASPFLQCLDVGGFAGAYTVSLSVSDGPMTTSTTTTLMVDEDHPACVKDTVPAPGTSPIVLDPGEAKTFAVTEILDDGAPFPTPAEGAHAAPTFAWKLRRNAGAWQAIVGYDTINALTLPAGTYATGDSVDVSVTISDGVAMHLQPACDPRCPAGCPQSAAWNVTYR